MAPNRRQAILLMWKKIGKKFSRRTISDWGKVLILLLDEAVVVVLVVMGLRYFEIRIPLQIMIPAAILFGALVFIIHAAVIPSFHRKQVAGREGMIGAEGSVVAPLIPVGTITLMGEYWKARTIDGHIEVDENVEVVGLEGLTLKVKHKPSG